MIALLVLGSASPKTLAPLLESLAGTSIRAFVHIDAKTDLHTYLAESGPLPPSTTVLADRVAVYWGGWSMMEATFRLMRTALADPAVEILTLVSDDTAVLRPASEVERSLREHPIRVDRHPVDTNELTRSRYEGLYFLDSIATGAAVPVDARRAEVDILRRAVDDLTELAALGKKPLRVHTGSQWWSLDRESAQHVLDCVDTDRHLRQSFRYSAVPDESLVQTLIAERRGPSRVRPYDRSPMLFDFSRQPAPFTFTEASDVRRFTRETQQHNKLFVRKVSPPLAAELSRRALVRKPEIDAQTIVDPFEVLPHLFPDTRRFVWMPNGGNLGDALIAAATKQRFGGAGVEWVDFQSASSSLGEGDVLVYGGGGALTPDYPGAFAALTTMHETGLPVVVLPSTVRGRHDFWKSTPPTTVFCRDRRSFAELTLHEQHSVFLAHDLAISCSLEVQPFAAVVSFRQALIDRGMLIPEPLPAFRVDDERLLDREPGIDVSAAWIPRMDEPAEVDSAALLLLSQLAPFRTVQTDRLHVAIACGILGIDASLFPDRNGKLREVYDLSLRSRFPTLTWAE